MSRFVRKEVRYRHGAVTEPVNSAAHIQGDAVAVGHTYHLESDAAFKRDLEQSLADIVKKRLQDAEDEALALVKIAEQTAEQNAKQIADDIINKATTQAQDMIAAAKAQVESIQDTAREQGFKTGFQEGYADATAQVESETVELLKSVHLLTEQAYKAEKQVLKNFEKNAVALITHLAKRVLKHELENSPEKLLDMAQHAIESLYLSGKVKMVVSAQALQEIRAFSQTTENALNQLHRFELTADPSLALGQIYIIGEEGCFDLSVDAQVSQLMEPLQEMLELPRLEPETAVESNAEIEPELSIAEPEIEPESNFEKSKILPISEPEMAIELDETEQSILTEKADPRPERILPEAVETALPEPAMDEKHATLDESIPDAKNAKPVSASPSEVQPFTFPELDDVIPKADEA